MDSFLRDHEAEKERREFRERAGRFAATAPAVAVPLSAKNDVGRRRVLTAVTCFALAPLGVFLGRYSVGTGQSRRDAVTDNLAQVLSNRTSVVRVGAAYLGTAPEDADPSIMIERMRRHGDALVRALETGSPGQVRRLVARDVREDFAQARIVKVDGWLLSQTEARLCALALVLWSGSAWPQCAECS